MATNSTSLANVTMERNVRAASGWMMLCLDFALLLVAAALLYGSFTAHPASGPDGTRALGALLAGVAGLVMLFGYFTLQPNEARVLVLFGSYRGTVRDSGFHWANPLYSRSLGGALGRGPGGDGGTALRNASLSDALARLQARASKLSLRARNFNSDTLKVNDKRGNPVEIAAVVVWRVEDTAQAVFDVEDYVSYVQVQSEAAIRGIASRYPYDHGDEHELTLRGSADEVALALKDELEVRLAKAGVGVVEARLTHLAYAAEIAPVMLRRQQAEAIVAARQIIVQNAVSMVHMALGELEQMNVVKLDDERRASMVSNLLVVLCGNNEASPVINTGTLYS
jgi:regulator of protease activity HflC (stomatin/prohibitin superfamily)